MTEMDKLISMMKDMHLEFDLADFSGTRIMSYPFHGDGCKATMVETQENWNGYFGLLDMDDNLHNKHVGLQDARSALNRMMEMEQHK